MAEKRTFLDGLEPSKIHLHEKTKTQFISIFMSVHQTSIEDAESFYERESNYFSQLFLDEKLALFTCTPISIYSAFLEIAINALSIKKQSQAEAYISKTGQKVGNGWIQVATFVIQAHGELALRVRAGQLVHATIPEILYDGDKCVPKTVEGKKIIEYEKKFPNESNKITGCFTILYLKDGLTDYCLMSLKDIERLHKTSIKFMKNESGNSLYSSGEDKQIDTGFLQAKTLKHAFKTLPRLKLSSNAVYEEEIISEQDDDKNGFDNGENLPSAEPETEGNKENIHSSPSLF